MIPIGDRFFGVILPKHNINFEINHFDDASLIKVPTRENNKEAGSLLNYTLP
jgi:hypothetical protein